MLSLSTVINKTIIDTLTKETFHLRILNKKPFIDDYMTTMNSEVDYITSFLEVENYIIRQRKTAVITSIDSDGNINNNPIPVVLSYDLDDGDNFLTFYGMNDPKNLIEGRVMDPNEMEIMLNDDLAKEYKIKVGDDIVLSSDMFVNRHETVKVVGTYRSNSIVNTDKTIFIKQDLIEMKRLGTYHIDMAIKDPMRVEDLADKMTKYHNNNVYSIDMWNEANKDFLAIDTLQKYVITAVIIAIRAILFIVVLNMLNYMIQKKYSEIGILKATGINERDARRIFSVQTFLITILSSTFGLITGNIWSKLYSNYMRDPVTNKNRFEYDITITHYLLLILASFIVSYLASVYSYRKTANLKTIELIKK